MMAAGEISFVINTPKGHSSRGDGTKMRSEAVSRGIDMATTMSGAVRWSRPSPRCARARLSVNALQDL